MICATDTSGQTIYATRENPAKRPAHLTPTHRPHSPGSEVGEIIYQTRKNCLAVSPCLERSPSGFRCHSERLLPELRSPNSGQWLLQWWWGFVRYLGWGSQPGRCQFNLWLPPGVSRASIMASAGPFPFQEVKYCHLPFQEVKHSPWDWVLSACTQGKVKWGVGRKITCR